MQAPLKNAVWRLVRNQLNGPLCGSFDGGWNVLLSPLNGIACSIAIRITVAFPPLHPLVGHLQAVDTLAGTFHWSTITLLCAHQYEPDANPVLENTRKLVFLPFFWLDTLNEPPCLWSLVLLPRLDERKPVMSSCKQIEPR